MELSRDIPQAAHERLLALLDEEEAISKGVVGQLGTSIPKVFYSDNNFIVNPANVGTATLSRMILTDDTVESAVGFLILMITSKIGEFYHEKPEIKSFVNDFLKKLKAPTWKRSLAAIASAKGFGFSGSEVVLGLNKKFQRVPIRIATYHPSTLAFEVDSTGQITPWGVLQYVYQYTQHANPNTWWAKIANGFKVVNPFTTPSDRLMPMRIPFVANYGLVRIPRAKCIHYDNMPEMSFGNPYGQTPVRTAHLPWQLKVFILKQLGIATKRNATNTLWGTAPHGGAKVIMEGPDGKKVELTPAQALRQMMIDREQDDALITGPETAGYKIENLSNAANLDQIVNTINACNVWIFRCFLMPSLIMTDGSAGSRSLGDKHFDIVDRVCDSDAELLGESVINDMIEPVIIANFGEQGDYGHFNRRPQSISERLMLMEMFSSAVNSGVMKNYSKGDMAYARDALHFPEDTDTSMEVKAPGDDGDRQPKPGEKAEKPKAESEDDEE